MFTSTSMIYPGTNNLIVIKFRLDNGDGNGMKWGDPDNRRYAHACFDDGEWGRVPS